MGRGKEDVGKGKGLLVHQDPKFIPPFLSNSQITVQTYSETQRY